MMSTIFSLRPLGQSAQQSLAICCPQCENPLTLHQPDPTLPDRLLATCDDCKSWFLAGSQGCLLMALPWFPDDATLAEAEF